MERLIRLLAPTSSRSVASMINHPLFLVLLVNFLIHLVFAIFLPLSNDEAYYWDWGQSLFLSFKDHPPGVAWMTYVSSSLVDGILAVRLLPPMLHTLSLWFSICTLKALLEDTGDETCFPKRVRWLVFITLSSPGLSLWGSVALPDVGLITACQGLLLCSVRWQKYPTLSLAQAIPFAFGLGIAGLFKYHAFPLGLGLSFGLMWVRGKKLRKDLGFWIVSFSLAIILCSPVWIWNSQNDWASFRFQAAHGFAEGSWNWKWPLRAIASVMLLLGPFLFILGSPNTWLKSKSRVSSKIIFPAFIGLLGLILLAALRKPILPHWTLPAFALVLPHLCAFASFGRHSRLLRLQNIYGCILMGGMLLVLNRPVLQAFTLPLFQGDPGLLSEITIWDQLAPLVKKQRDDWQHNIKIDQSSKRCASPLPLATLRWFSSAQLHFRLLHEAPILVLGEAPHSYYRDRDREKMSQGACLAIILETKQFGELGAIPTLQILESRDLVVPGHEKQHWQMVLVQMGNNQQQKS